MQIILNKITYSIQINRSYLSGLLLIFIQLLKLFFYYFIRKYNRSFILFLYGFIREFSCR